MHHCTVFQFRQSLTTTEKAHFLSYDPKFRRLRIRHLIRVEPTVLSRVQRALWRNTPDTENVLLKPAKPTDEKQHCDRIRK